MVWSSSCVEIKDSSEFQLYNVKNSKLTSSEDRVRAGAAKLSKMLAAKQQGRLDGFFTVKPKEGDAAKGKGKKDDKKRKGDDKGGAKKKGKK